MLLDISAYVTTMCRSVCLRTYGTYSSVASFSSCAFPLALSGLLLIKRGVPALLIPLAGLSSPVSSLRAWPRSLPAIQFFVSSGEFSPASTPSLNSEDFVFTSGCISLIISASMNVRPNNSLHNLANQRFACRRIQQEGDGRGYGHTRVFPLPTWGHWHASLIQCRWEVQDCPYPAHIPSLRHPRRQQRRR